MRQALIGCVLVLATRAGAAPWADWVGDYQGALSWRNCTAPGEKTVTIAIDGVDGTLQIDLAPAGAALRSYSLQQNATGWDTPRTADAHDGDVDVSIARKKPNELELVIEIDSTCTARGKLARKTSRVVACDRLLGWARIEHACTKKTSAPLEDFTTLARAKWKASDAKQCTARADKLELAMIDAGCAPHPDPDIGVRALECRSLADATARLARCGRVPRAILQRLASTANALSAASQSADHATLPYVERQCRDARIDVAAAAVEFRCRL